MDSDISKRISRSSTNRVDQAEPRWREAPAATLPSRDGGMCVSNEDDRAIFQGHRRFLTTPPIADGSPERTPQKWVFRRERTWDIRQGAWDMIVRISLAIGPRR
jgi:hypothetical protein